MQQSPLQISVAPSVTRSSEVQQSHSVAPSVTRSSEDQDDPLEPLREKYKNSGLHFSLKKVSTQDVKKVIQKLKKKTSSGFDDISAEILKMGADVLVEPLTHIINRSIETGKFPTQWKHSSVPNIQKR